MSKKIERARPRRGRTTTPYAPPPELPEYPQPVRHTFDELAKSAKQILRLRTAKRGPGRPVELGMPTKPEQREFLRNEVRYLLDVFGKITADDVAKATSPWRLDDRLGLTVLVDPTREEDACLRLQSYLLTTRPSPIPKLSKWEAARLPEEKDSPWRNLHAESKSWASGKQVKDFDCVGGIDILRRLAKVALEPDNQLRTALSIVALECRDWTEMMVEGPDGKKQVVPRQGMTLEQMGWVYRGKGGRGKRSQKTEQ